MSESVRHFNVSLGPEMMEKMLSPSGVGFQYTEYMVFDLSCEFEDEEDLRVMAEVLESAADDLRDEYRAVTEKEASP